MEVIGAVDTVAENILAPRIREHRSIEGRLEYVNIHGGRNVFGIWPTVGPTRVHCILPKAKLPEARQAVGCDVRVFGDLVFREREDLPFEVYVQEIIQLEDDENLPTMADLPGAVSAKRLKGETAEDFVRKVRGEW